MKDIVVDLPRPICICEVDKPVSPPTGIVNGEWANIRSAKAESVKDDLLGCAEPVRSAHQPIEYLHVVGGNAQVVELRAQLLGLVLLEKRKQRRDDEGVKDFGRWPRTHDIKDRTAFNMAMAALIEIEDYASVPSLTQHLLDFRIGDLEEVVQIFHPQVQFGTSCQDVSLHRRDMSFQ